jgi:hypothetical protein
MLPLSAPVATVAEPGAAATPVGAAMLSPTFPAAGGVRVVLVVVVVVPASFFEHPAAMSRTRAAAVRMGSGFWSMAA